MATPGARMTPSALARLIEDSPGITLDAGQCLFSQGDACRALHVLVSGRVRCYQARDDGREQVVSTFEAPGEVFCLMAAFGAGRYVFSAQALTATELHTVDVATITRLATQSTALGVALLVAATRQAAGLVELVEDLALRRVPERIARLLRERALRDGRRWGPGAELERRRFRSAR